MKYQILQLDRNCVDYRSKIFSSLRMLKSLGLSISLADYNVAYTGVYTGTYVAERFINEEIFQKFNLAHPSDFTGHSMSVSDIIYYPDSGNYYFCDSFGFAKVF